MLPQYEPGGVARLDVEEQEGRLWASVEAVCINEAEKEVLLAHILGFVSRACETALAKRLHKVPAQPGLCPQDVGSAGA